MSFANSGDIIRGISIIRGQFGQFGGHHNSGDITLISPRRWGNSNRGEVIYFHDPALTLLASTPQMETNEEGKFITCPHFCLCPHFWIERMIRQCRSVPGLLASSRQPGYFRMSTMPTGRSGGVTSRTIPGTAPANPSGRIHF